MSAPKIVQRRDMERTTRLFVCLFVCLFVSLQNTEKQEVAKSPFSGKQKLLKSGNIRATSQGCCLV